MTGARVLAHPQVVEYQTHVTRELSHFLRHTSSAFGFEHADGETTKPGDVFRTMAGTDATAVLIIVPIDHVVATLDHPMPTVDLEHALRAGLFPRAAGEAVRNFPRALAALFVRAVPLDDERLAHMRKIEITVQFRGRPDLAGFDASVVWRGMLDKMRLAAIPEIELQGFQKTGLISFDREIVVRLALLDQIRASSRWVSRASAVRSLPAISMASSSGIAVLISLVRLTSSFPLSSMGKVPTFFGCSKSCFADRPRSSHACAGPAHPGRCTWSCRRWPDSHPLRHSVRSSIARRDPDRRA